MSDQKLSRKKAHRSSLRRNLLKSLIVNERIATTLTKAKYLVPFAERVFHLAQKGDLAAKQRIESLLAGKGKAYKKLLEYWPAKIADRKSGFVKYVRLGPRKGDAAEMVIVEVIGAEAPAVLAKARTLKQKTQEEKIEKEKNA